MKKLLQIILALTLVFTLAACQTDEDPDPKQDPVEVSCEVDPDQEKCEPEPIECTSTQTQVGDECIENSVLDTELLQEIVDDFGFSVALDELVVDLTLPATEEEASITWLSSDATVITNEGVVTQSLTGDATAKLTATFAFNGIEISKEFDVTVLKLRSEPYVTIPESGIVSMTINDATSLDGVVATDDNDGDITDDVIILGVYDVTKAGFYNVTLVVTDSDGQSASKSALLQVSYADPVVITGETWGVAPEEVKSLVVFDIIENFMDGDTFNIALFDGVVKAPTIFHNTSNEEVTISVTNAYGVGAILDANGVVLESRDGANGRLVNELCGLRALCPQGSLDATDPLANLTIPAGGFAVVAPNQNTSYNEDGRKFVNEQVGNRIEKVVEMKMGDTLWFTYADQAPFVTIDNKVKPAGSFTLNATKGTPVNVLDGVKLFDDNGVLAAPTEIVKTDSFDPVVSVKLYDAFGTEYVVTDYTSYTFEYEGSYDVEVVITDGTNERLVETQITVFLFEELSAPAFRITGDDFVYIDLMKVPYTYNFLDTDDIDTASYHLYDDHSKLLNATTTEPHSMGWASFIMFDAESGEIEVNYNIFHDKVYVADGVTYVDVSLFTDAKGLAGITDIPEGKILLVGPQLTDLRSFALGNTSRDMTGSKIEFINVPEVPSIVPTYETSTLVFNVDGTVTTIDVSGYYYNWAYSGTNNMPTGAVDFHTDYNNILGLDGTPLNMGWGSYLIIDEQTKVIEVYANWANVFTVDGVDYVDGTSLAAANVLDTITSLPAGKMLIIAPQGTQLRDDLHNVIGSNTDISGTTLGIFEVYDEATIVIETGDEKYAIALSDFYVDEAITGTNNMPTGAVDFHTDLSNVIGLDGTPLNMGYGSYMIIDEATGVIEVYGNWANVFTIDGVDYVDGTNLAAANVLDTITSLPAGKMLIISPQGTQLRDDLHNVIGTNTDITGGTVKLYTLN